MADLLADGRSARTLNVLDDFNRTVRPSQRCFASPAGQRAEWFGQYIFETIEEAQEQATEWLWTYNNDRPTWASAA